MRIICKISVPESVFAMNFVKLKNEKLIDTAAPQKIRHAILKNWRECKIRRHKIRGFAGYFVP